MRKAGLAFVLAAWLLPVAAQPKVEDRIMSCDPKVALAAAKEVIESPASLKQPFALFLPVAILYQNGERDEAVFWFYAALLRARLEMLYQSGLDAPFRAVMDTSGALINSYAYQDIAKFNTTLDRVLEWDRKTPNPFRERAKTPEERERVGSVYTGLGEMRAKLNAQKESVEQRAREVGELLQKEAREVQAKRCPA